MKKIIRCCLFSFAFLSGYPQFMDTAHVTGLSVGRTFSGIQTRNTISADYDLQ